MREHGLFYAALQGELWLNSYIQYPDIMAVCAHKLFTTQVTVGNLF